MAKIQIKIFDTKSGEVRYVYAKAGQIVPIRKRERVIEHYPIGVIKDGDPVLTMEERLDGVTASESKYLVWDTRQTPDIKR